MNVDDYLKRFNSANYKEPSIQNLFRLQSNHLLNVPFENLDIHLNCQYESLDLEFLYDKIVNKKRGGFCCELNYLFYWLLDRLGYRVALLTCRPYQVKREQYSEWFSHMALQVSMNESQFIVDVGFAQNYRAPLKFQLNHIQPDVTGHYKIVPAAAAAVAAQHAAAPTPNASSRRLEQVTVAPVAIEPSGESSSSNNNNNNNNNTVVVTTTTTANQHLNPNSIYASSTSFTSSSSSSSSTSSSTFSSSPSNANHLHHHNTFVIQKSLSEDLAQWMPLYEFNIIPKRIEEFKHMVEFVKSKEHLRFHERILMPPNRSICVIHTTYSVLKLVGHKLSEVIFSNSTEKSRTQSTLTTNEVFDAIRNIYGITLDREFEPKEEQ